MKKFSQHVFIYTFIVSIGMTVWSEKSFAPPTETPISEEATVIYNASSDSEELLRNLDSHFSSDADKIPRVIDNYVNLRDAELNSEAWKLFSRGETFVGPLNDYVGSHSEEIGSYLKEAKSPTEEVAKASSIYNSLKRFMLGYAGMDVSNIKRTGKILLHRILFLYALAEKYNEPIEGKDPQDMWRVMIRYITDGHLDNDFARRFTEAIEIYTENSGTKQSRTEIIHQILLEASREIATSTESRGSFSAFDTGDREHTKSTVIKRRLHMMAFALEEITKTPLETSQSIIESARANLETAVRNQETIVTKITEGKGTATWEAVDQGTIEQFIREKMTSDRSYVIKRTLERGKVIEKMKGPKVTAEVAEKTAVPLEASQIRSIEEKLYAREREINEKLADLEKQVIRAPDSQQQVIKLEINIWRAQLEAVKASKIEFTAKVEAAKAAREAEKTHK